MKEKLNKPEPKKIKMPSLVDRSTMYDTMSFDEDTLPDPSGYKTFWKTYSIQDENHNKNNSQGLSELESL